MMGFIIRSMDTPQEAKGIDLLIVSLKYGALPGAMDSIRQVTGENTGRRCYERRGQ